MGSYWSENGLLRKIVGSLRDSLKSQGFDERVYVRHSSVVDIELIMARGVEMDGGKKITTGVSAELDTETFPPPLVVAVTCHINAHEALSYVLKLETAGPEADVVVKNFVKKSIREVKRQQTKFLAERPGRSRGFSVCPPPKK